MRLEDDGLDPAIAPDAPRERPARQVDPDAFAAHIRVEHLPHALIADCSASGAVAACYPQRLAAGIPIVTPNKHADSSDWLRSAMPYATAAVSLRSHGEPACL